MSAPTAEDSRALLERLTGHTRGPWKCWTSNSWRRLKHDGPGLMLPVLEPFVASDGHPDCCVSSENMAIIAAAPDLAAHLRAALDREAAALERMKNVTASQPETLDEGTLSELGLKPGDVVERLSGHDRHSEHLVGETYEVTDKSDYCRSRRHLRAISDAGWTSMMDKGRFRVLSRADSPPPHPTDREAAALARVEEAEAERDAARAEAWRTAIEVVSGLRNLQEPGPMFRLLNEAVDNLEYARRAALALEPGA